MSVSQLTHLQVYGIGLYCSYSVYVVIISVMIMIFIINKMSTAHECGGERNEILMLT